jgi:hypothetical protein
MIEDKTPLRTPIEQLGFGLIDHITKSFEIVNTGTVKAIAMMLLW